MFEKYLERLIKQKLGAFLEGVDENKLNFGVRIRDILINHDADDRGEPEFKQRQT
jgi:hypothetical protein